MFRKQRKLKVQETEVSVKQIGEEDYISLTDMLKAKDGSFYIESWLRNRNTIEFIGMWESIHNPEFNFNEFDEIRKRAGLNSFRLSAKEWCERTRAIGIKAVAGRYGGTYAHKDIAFEFGMWISPAFKLYLIKDYERLKEIESNQYQLEWDARRILASSTYKVHTDAVKDVLTPHVLPWKVGYQYASEADLINLAVFGMTAKEWREANPAQAKQGKNPRDTASINELLVMEILQLENSKLIRQKVDKEERFNVLSKLAHDNLVALSKVDAVKDLKRLDDSTYLAAGE